MDSHRWKAAIVASNKFEAKLLNDLLRNGGATDVRVLTDPSSALEYLRVRATDVVLAAVEPEASDPFQWVRSLRRDQTSVSRKTAIFVVSSALTMPCPI